MYLLLSMDLEQGGLTPNLNMFIKHEYTISQQTIDVLTKKYKYFKVLKVFIKCCQGFLTDLLPQQCGTRQVLRLSSVALSHTQSRMHHCETGWEIEDAGQCRHILSVLTPMAKFYISVTY